VYILVPRAILRISCFLGSINAVFISHYVKMFLVYSALNP
jgi:hypothetical protein